MSNDEPISTEELIEILETDVLTYIPHIDAIADRLKTQSEQIERQEKVIDKAISMLGYLEYSALDEEIESVIATLKGDQSE